MPKIRTLTNVPNFTRYIETDDGLPLPIIKTLDTPLISTPLVSVREPLRNIRYDLGIIDSQTNYHIKPTGDSNIPAIHFIGNKSIPMGDWDWPDGLHPDSSISIRDVKDVHDVLSEYVGKNPNSTWRMYLTPGGVRAFNVTDILTPQDFAQRNLFEDLNIDKNYGRFSQKSPVFYPYNTEFGVRLEPTFTARISGKPTRPDTDFIAEYIGDIGYKQQPPFNAYPEHINRIKQYHDKPIRLWQKRQIQKNPNYEEGHREAFLDLLDKHLAILPKAFKHQVEKNVFE